MRYVASAFEPAGQDALLDADASQDCETRTAGLPRTAPCHDQHDPRRKKTKIEDTTPNQYTSTLSRIVKRVEEIKGKARDEF